jgi:predicted transcriptional regulator
MDSTDLNEESLELTKVRGVVFRELGSRLRLKPMPLDTIHRQLKTRLKMNGADDSYGTLEKIFFGLEANGLLKLKEEGGKKVVEWEDHGRAALKKFQETTAELIGPYSKAEILPGGTYGKVDHQENDSTHAKIDIRPGLSCQLVIPKDITQEEADLLVQTVSTLATMWVKRQE